MQKLKVVLAGGALILTSAVALAQGGSLSTSSGATVDTNKPNATMNSDADVNTKTGKTGAAVNAKSKMKNEQGTTGADVNAGTRPSSAAPASK